MQIRPDDSSAAIRALVHVGGFFANADGTMDIQPPHLGELDKAGVGYTVTDPGNTYSERWQKIGKAISQGG